MNDASPSGHPADEAGVTAHCFASALDDLLRLAGPTGHHLARVRRLRVAESVTVALDDASGTWRRYSVAAVGRDTVELVADGEAHVEPAAVPDVVAGVSLITVAHFEAVVAPLSELGVRVVVPLVADRSVVAASKLRPDRLARIAEESACQCRRARPLVVASAVRSHDFLTAAGCVLVDRGGDTVTGVLAALGGDARAPWRFATGPEGGWTDTERALHASAGGPALAVGAFVLRAQTAPVAAAAAIGAVVPARRA